MTIKVAINGYGRIGRNILRAHYEDGKRHDLAIVATSADNHHGDAYSDEISTLVSAVLIKPFDLDHFDSAAGLGPT